MVSIINVTGLVFDFGINFSMISDKRFTKFQAIESRFEFGLGKLGNALRLQRAGVILYSKITNTSE